MGSMSLRIVSPLAEYLDEIDASSLAPRPASLEGKVIGLLPNWRPSALQLLEAIGTLLEKRCRPRAVIMEQMLGALPVTGKLLDGMRERLDGFVTRVDVVIAASGD
jgi:hypothetical protein